MIDFFSDFFLLWNIFKVFIEFITILFLFYVLVFWPRGMWDLSSSIRDWTHTPCIGRRSLNHWTARQVSIILLLVISHRKFLFENESLVAECKELRQHTTLCKQNEECTVLGVNIALLLDMKPHCFCNMQAPDNVQFKALCRWNNQDTSLHLKMADNPAGLPWWSKG